MTPVSALQGTALVTGGTGALGRAVVAELLDAGARVVATWIVASERDEVEAELGGRGSLELVEADVGAPEGAARALEAVGPDERLAAVACLVGGFSMGGRLHESDEGALGSMLDLNLLTTERTLRAALPRLVAGGGGTVVCVGSKAALEPFPGGTAYAVSKAAVLALVRAVDAEYGGERVRANAILPDIIDTPANREAMPDADRSSWVSPGEIARVVRFLCSGDSGPTTGAWIPVYGAG